MLSPTNAESSSAIALRDHEDRVYATRVETLYRHAPQVLLANLVNAGVVGAILWDTAQTRIIAGWWAAMALMVLVRVVVGRQFKRRPADSKIAAWAGRFTVGSLVSGLIWGLGAVALFPPEHGPSQVLLAFVVGGMAAGASSSVGSHLPAFYAFLFPAVVPVAVRFAVVGDKFHIGMAGMLALFTLLVGMIGRTTHRTLVESYRLRFTNETLVEELSEARSTLEDRVVERTRSLQAETKARGEVERKLQHMQKLEAVGRLTGGVAHDFNNLLTVVVQSLEILEQKTVREDLKEPLRTALAAALRGGELTHSLLAFSRRQDLRPEVVDASAAVERLVSSLLQRVLPESIRVVADRVEDPALTTVDPAQLETALLNLALNARDAIKGRGTIQFNVGHTRLGDGDAELPPGGYVEVAVADDGEGIPPDVLEHVFDPFFTTKGEGGSGLGLSMVYGFARQSGGTVRIRSKPGAGTTVRMLLPLATGGSPIEHVEPPTLDGDGELILVVEDDPIVRAMAVSSLKGLGYDTIEARDSAHALRALKRRSDIQLVLSDVVMPGELDGIGLAAAIEERFSNVSTLLVSGYSEPRNTSTKHPILRKPYRRTELATALRRALEGAT